MRRLTVAVGMLGLLAALAASPAFGGGPPPDDASAQAEDPVGSGGRCGAARHVTALIAISGRIRPSLAPPIEEIPLIERGWPCQSMVVYMRHLL